MSKRDRMRAGQRREQSKAALYNRIDEIRPNPDQPRRHMDAESLAELADSIREHGLVNPITLDGTGMIIAGERRWRALPSEQY